MHLVVFFFPPQEAKHSPCLKFKRHGKGSSTIIPNHSDHLLGVAGWPVFGVYLEMLCVYTFCPAYALSLFYAQIYHLHTAVYLLFIWEVIFSLDAESMPSYYCMCCRVFHGGFIFPAPFYGHVGGLQASEGNNLGLMPLCICINICTGYSPASGTGAQRFKHLVFFFKKELNWPP